MRLPNGPSGSSPEVIPYSPFPAVVLRTPLFPLNFLHQVCGPSQWNDQTARFVCGSPEVREAIYLASPNLHSEIDRWLEGGLTDEREVKRFFFSLQRYAVRLSMRCTPFGLFAGTTCGQWGERTVIELKRLSEYHRHTRLDMHYLCSLIEELAKRSDIAADLIYFPNSTLYHVGNHLRYVEYNYLNNRRRYRIVGIDYTDYLEKILERALRGAKREELIDLLVDGEIGRNDAQAYVQELLDNQVLVHNLEPSLTGPEFLDIVLQVLQPMTAATKIHRDLSLVRDTLQTIDSKQIGQTLDNFRLLADELKSLGTSFRADYLFQTDMIATTNICTFERRLADDILLGVALLNRLTPPLPETNLGRFREAFLNRYEQRQIPLLEALDKEMGIGYVQHGERSGDIAPLIDDLTPATNRITSQTMPWNYIDSFLFGKYRQALLDRSLEVTITDNEVTNLPLIWDDLPDTLAVMAHLVLEDGPQSPPTLIFNEAGGSAGNLLGRFCHSDRLTYDLVKQIMAREAELRADVIFAEIVHLPEARVGNILLRPVLRNYEIPYLARSTLSEAQQIRPSDLEVSVRGNRVVLRSRRLNREVRPRLTSAHNTSIQALPIYQFLCDLQFQKLRAGVGFYWGNLSREMPFRPRVRYRNLILALATWQISKEETVPLNQAQEADNSLRMAISEFRHKRSIPLEVCLTDGDNELYINFDNLLSVRSLLAQVKKRNFFTLKEFVISPSSTPVQSADGNYANEAVFLFYRNTQGGQASHE